MTYSTLFEFNDSINSLKSFGRSMLGDQLQQDVDALLGRERAVEFAIRLFGFLKGTKDSNRCVSAHHDLIIRRWCATLREGLEVLLQFDRQRSGDCHSILRRRTGKRDPLGMQEIAA